MHNRLLGISTPPASGGLCCSNPFEKRACSVPSFLSLDQPPNAKDKSPHLLAFLARLNRAWRCSSHRGHLNRRWSTDSTSRPHSQISVLPRSLPSNRLACTFLILADKEHSLRFLSVPCIMFLLFTRKSFADSMCAPFGLAPDGVSVQSGTVSGTKRRFQHLVSLVWNVTDCFRSAPFQTAHTNLRSTSRGPSRR